MRTRCNFRQGEIITGKWNKNFYRIVKELGYGANGIVYLVEKDHQLFALKVSDNSTSITSEMNILKSFSKVQGSALGPCFLEADDFLRNGVSLSFYVMEYIKGENLLDFVRKNGTTWIGVLMLQLLNSLSELHKNGWVFGDLKPENLIVTTPLYKVRCVDVGGTTVIGRSIKEFTEFFDRGYWGLGSRKADEKYDLFAAAMIMINVAYPSKFNKKGEGYSQLREKITQNTLLKPYEKWLEKALLGKYKSAVAMRDELIQLLNKPKQEHSTSPVTKQKARNNLKSKGRTRVKKKRARIMETFLIVVVLSTFYVLYIFEQWL